MMAAPTILGSAYNPAKQRGFTYLLVLAAVFMLLLGLTTASEQIATVSKREREAELVFIGQQYRNAIASYYYKSPNGIKQLPIKLEDLLEDKRSLITYHHLRKLYRDPMTQNPQWGLVQDAQGKISGVYSLSNEIPMRTQPDGVVTLAPHASGGARFYADWQFVFKPSQDNSIATPKPESPVIDVDVD